MKGVIAQCLKGLIVDKFGAAKWTAVANMAGVDGTRPILSSADVPDEVVGKLIQATCSVLGISATQAADAFGEYWATAFAPKIYSSIYERSSNAAEFLMNMDEVHVMVTRTIPNAAPPRFVCRWKNDRTLVMEYHSRRKMIDIMAGLVKGVAHHFQDEATVSRLDETTLEIVFAKARQRAN